VSLWFLYSVGRIQSTCAWRLLLILRWLTARSAIVHLRYMNGWSWLLRVFQSEGYRVCDLSLIQSVSSPLTRRLTILYTVPWMPERAFWSDNISITTSDKRLLVLLSLFVLCVSCIFPLQTNIGSTEQEIAWWLEHLNLQASVIHI